jgi:hypothetical protein
VGRVVHRKRVASTQTTPADALTSIFDATRQSPLTEADHAGCSAIPRTGPRSDGGRTRRRGLVARYTLDPYAGTRWWPSCQMPRRRMNPRTAAVRRGALRTVRALVSTDSGRACSGASIPTCANTPVQIRRALRTSSSITY